MKSGTASSFRQASNDLIKPDASCWGQGRSAAGRHQAGWPAALRPLR
jgi:hypothetical protein